MARYIDAELIEWHEQITSLGNGMYEDVRVVYMDDIDAIPSADVRENVHGKWIDDGTELGLCCDKCGTTLDDYLDGALFEIRMCKIPNYCLNCGADMRGEQNDTD